MASDTIEAAAAGCRAAFKANPHAEWENFRWHDQPLTKRTSAESWKRRIEFILEHKPEHERITRLDNYRPVRNPERLPQAVKDAWAECNRAKAERDRAWAEYDRVEAEYDRAGAALECAGAALDRVITAHAADIAALRLEEWPDTTPNTRNLFEPDAEVRDARLSD